MVNVIKDLKGTVAPDELQRAKAYILSSLVIGEESTSSRAGSNAGDWWTNRRVRSLDEIADGIRAVTAEDINAYCEAYPANEFFLLTLGSKQLELPRAVA
ncbi:MAG: hypothetical protein R3A13_03930 [Bdellovibrionota bacterium]